VYFGHVFTFAASLKPDAGALESLVGEFDLILFAGARGDHRPDEAYQMMSLEVHVIESQGAPFAISSHVDLLSNSYN
jgi:hypothetical protein